MDAPPKDAIVKPSEDFILEPVGGGSNAGGGSNEAADQEASETIVADGSDADSSEDGAIKKGEENIDQA